MIGTQVEFSLYDHNGFRATYEPYEFTTHTIPRVGDHLDFPSETTTFVVTKVIWHMEPYIKVSIIAKHAY